MSPKQRAAQVCDNLLGYAGQLTEHTPTPGGCVVVADAEGILAQGSFGLADLERRTAVETSHKFELGSISKIFTGLLVNQLVDEGRISLDSRIEEVLPWVRLGEHGSQVTVRHLLNHSAGLVAGVDSLTDAVDQAWALRDLSAVPPGVRFHYSNVGYVLLGLAIEACTGLDLAANLRDRLFVPLGMTATVGAITNADRRALATGYQPAYDDRPWVPGDDLAPAPWFEVAAADGNVGANGSDMARLIALLLGDGQVAERRVMSEAAMLRIVECLAPGGEPVLDPPGAPPVVSSRYGLGVNVEEIGGHLCLTHGGGMVGYSSFLLVDRASGLGIAVLTNANGDGLTAQLLARLGHADLVAGGPDRVRFPAADRLVLAAGSDLDGALPPPVGRFVCSSGAEGETRLVVDVDPRHGSLRVTQGGVSGRLFASGSGRFVADHPGMRRFCLDPADLDRGPGWVHGPDVYEWEDSEATSPVPVQSRLEPLSPALVGHYRSYSPWYPHMRVFSRGGRLWLAAPGGVEAPSHDEELVPLSGGTYRIGADVSYPERLVAGPVVDGQVVSVTRDGCRYSRTFTE